MAYVWNTTIISSSVRYDVTAWRFQTNYVFLLMIDVLIWRHMCQNWVV